MSELKKRIKEDLYRYYGDEKVSPLNKIRCFGWRYTKVLRAVQYYRNKNKLLYLYYSFLQHKLQVKFGFQIPSKTVIGKGLFLGHFGSIIVNSAAVLGDNVNLSPNVVIGQQNRGKNKGVPTIGNNVWIGCGAVVVGKITIGDDVMIAPNAYVNFDVPPHSIVVGNPGIIHQRENATEGYVENCV